MLQDRIVLPKLRFEVIFEVLIALSKPEFEFIDSMIELFFIDLCDEVCEVDSLSMNQYVNDCKDGGYVRQLLLSTTKTATLKVNLTTK